MQVFAFLSMSVSLSVCLSIYPFLWETKGLLVLCAESWNYTFFAIRSTVKVSESFESIFCVTGWNVMSCMCVDKTYYPCHRCHKDVNTLDHVGE